MLITRRYHLLFSILFFKLGAQALLARKIGVRYQNLNLALRIIINLSYLTINYVIVRYAYDFIGNS